jgi:hypothetical protein
MSMRFSVALVLGLAAAPAFAQEAPLDRIYACTSMTDGAARLACFDTAVATLKQADAAGGVAVVDRAKIVQAEKEAFGLVAPTLTAIAESASSSATVGKTAAEKAKPLDRVSLKVKAVEKGADGRYRFTMEDGQVWRQTDDLKLPAVGKGPWTAEIRKAAIGTFLLKLDNRTAVRAKRVE